VALPFLAKPRSIVGIDIGSSSIKAVELAVKPKGFELLHVGVAPLPPEAIVQGAFLNSGAIVEALSEALANGGIRSKRVAAAVYGHSVIVKKISLPSMTRDELEESIRWEAEQYIPFDINEVNLDFQILETGETEGQMDVLLVAAKKDLIDDYVSVLGEAGLQPAVIDVAAFAVANAYQANYAAGRDEVVALVNIGAQTVNINILSGGVPAFTRDVSAGGNQYTEEIQKTLSVGFEEAERIKLGKGAHADGQEVIPQEVEEAVQSVSDTVVSEISRSLDFFQATSAESRIGRVMLSGGGAKIAGLDKLFQERAQIPVERLNPLARMLPGTRFDEKFVQELAPELGVCVGLALRKADA
jgi:type IV pilus assembly protein PilM